MIPTSTRPPVSETALLSSRASCESFGVRFCRHTSQSAAPHSFSTGKPHPRWAEPNFCDGDATEKWHSRASRRTQLQIQRQRAMEGSQSSPVVKTEQQGESSNQPQLYRMSPSPGPALSFDGSGYREGHPPRPPYPWDRLPPPVTATSAMHHHRRPVPL